MKSNGIPDDKNIEHVDFYKDIVDIYNENEPEVVSIDKSFICFDKLKSYLLNNKKLDHDVYDFFKCIEAKITADKKERKYRTILDYLKKNNYYKIYLVFINPCFFSPAFLQFLYIHHLWQKSGADCIYINLS
ncbi:hypothetical protein DMUE_3481 [Dictyocoela muelleri]|nr:hypothetical protein DMUE_3481 [Dictyocoela muelleri]